MSKWHRNFPNTSAFARFLWCYPGQIRLQKISQSGAGAATTLLMHCESVETLQNEYYLRKCARQHHCIAWTSWMSHCLGKTQCFPRAGRMHFIKRQERTSKPRCRKNFLQILVTGLYYFSRHFCPALLTLVVSLKFLTSMCRDANHFLECAPPGGACSIRFAEYLPTSSYGELWYLTIAAS